ncbi:MAG: sugar ABC transporter permease [Acidobacteriota bacterium]|nr:sugar ABC transporter permease [Acidobacteriota bacterium]MDQ5838541.1 sugar ABC transporter permease [Acidobacteriota bacterium]
MSHSANEPATKRPLTTADMAPPDAVPEGVPARVGGFRLPTESLRAYTMIFALIAIWIFFQWATADAAHPYGLFLTGVNFSKLLQQMSVTGVLAVGMLMVIVAGQIDLSVGSVVGLAGMISALTVTQQYGFAGSIIAAILIGVAVGAVQGALVAYGNIPAFIVTLGGLLAWRGAIFWISRGETKPIELESYRSLGHDLIAPVIGYVLAAAAIAAIAWLNIRRSQARKRHGLSATGAGALALRVGIPSLVIVAFVVLMNSAAVGGVPILVVIMFIVALGGGFLTQNTTFGRYLYAIGGNPDAARLSGINLRRHICITFAIMGGLVGVAALLHTSRLLGATPDAGTLMELDAIAACVIGGTSLMGGRGTVFGAIIGALIMASLDNGMNLIGVQAFAQQIAKGVVLVVAVGFDMLGRRKS